MSPALAMVRSFVSFVFWSLHPSYDVCSA
jgi:hypothetical protein